MRDAWLRGHQDEQDRKDLVAGPVTGQVRPVGASDHRTGTGHHWLPAAHTDGELRFFFFSIIYYNLYGSDCIRYSLVRCSSTTGCFVG